MRKAQRILSVLVMVVLGLISATTPGVVNAAQVTLQWDANSPVPDGYRVFLRDEGEGYSYAAPVWQGSATTCTLTEADGISDDGKYYFIVRAYVGADESGDSNEVVWVGPTYQEQSTGAFKITSSALSGGEISPEGEVDVAAGSAKSFMVTPQPEYGILDVLADGMSVGPRSMYTFFNVQSDHQIIASFGLDSDGDGYADDIEMGYWGEGWTQDADGDGINNLIDPDADGDGWSDGGELLIGTDPGSSVSVPISVPSGVSISVLNGEIVFRWDPNPASQNIISYTVEYGLYSGVYTYSEETVDAFLVLPSWLIGHNVFIRVSAENEHGTVSTQEYSFNLALPTAPQGIAVSIVNGIPVVTWNANPAGENVTGYTLKYGLYSGTYARTVNAGTNTTANMESWTVGRTVYLVLTATNANGIKQSVEYSFNLALPTAPQGIAVSIVNGIPVVTWNANPAGENVTGYTLKYGLYTGTYARTVNAGTNTTANMETWTVGRKIYLIVEATNANGTKKSIEFVKLVN